jgi:mono/diheme cytochrome c family protein
MPVRTILAAVAAALVAATPAAPAPAPGAKVFASAGCGACHTLKAAKATGKVGPNLDVLRPTAAQVASQVRSGGGGMPSYAGRLGRTQISQVAAFVAGASRALPKRAFTGRELFRTHCGRCHTLAAAGTNGSVGPNLDDERPDAARVQAAMAEGPDVMPSFTGRLTPAERSRVAAFVARSTAG